jgi:F-type H+-transporting ATPase subunit gamma
MAKYHHIKRKIRTVKNTRQITKAMQLVAGSKLRRARERLEAVRRYQNKLHEIMQYTAAFQKSISHPLSEGRPVRTRGLVVLASSRGLCGAYNSNLLRLAQHWIDTGKTPVQVISIGRRTRDYFVRQGQPPLESFPQPDEALETEELRPIAKRILHAYLSGEVDSVHLVYARFRSALVNIPTVVQLVPVDFQASSSEVPVDLIVEPPPECLLQRLLPRVIEIELMGYLAESLASEHGARMVAMQNATSNAAELIDLLTLRFNRARQASITQEILEVVSGAQALEA